MTGRRSNQLNYAPAGRAIVAGAPVGATATLRPSLATVDWIALAVVVLAALAGLRRGLVASALSLGGLVPARTPARASRRTCSHGGSASPWTPLAGLAGALAGAGLLLQAVASAAGRSSAAG